MPTSSDHAGWSRFGGGVAKIEYTLPKAGHVRIRVFDMAGREVAAPVDERQSAGPHFTLFAFGPDATEFVYGIDCDGRKRSGKISVAP